MERLRQTKIADENALIASMDDTTRGTLRLRDQKVSLGETVLDAEIPASVFFPAPGTVVSIIRETEDGSTVEVGLAGFEGMFSVHSILSAGPQKMKAVVQAEGSCLVVDAGRLREVALRTPALNRALLSYVSVFLEQVGQNALCNRLHSLEQRLAKWLLMMVDRVGVDDLKLTHEFISHMLGVRRAGVTLAVKSLETAGLIRHSRSLISISDEQGIEKLACECAHIIRASFLSLTGRTA